MASEKRVTAITQLVPGTDDDLIRWLQRQPNRSQAVKDALRRGLGMPVATGSSQPVASISPALEAELRSKLAQVDKLIAMLQTRIDQPFAPSEPAVTEADRISETVKADRLSRLKKSSW
jgi:hypothetical protein